MKILVLLLALCFAPALLADSAPNWNQLTVQQQQVLSALESKWDAMPVERRQQLLKKADNFSKLTPVQQEKILQRFETWKSLPEDQKEVLVMRMYQDLSFKEIAELTGVSINTALGRMRYALLNLRKIIEKNQIILTN